MEYTIVSGERIRERRGDRSLRDVVKESGNAFCAAALLKWEHGTAQPGRNKLPHLLNALGCSYHDISVPIDLGIAK